MQELIAQIFITHGFLPGEAVGNAKFYARDSHSEVEYYLVTFIRQEDVPTYLESDDYEGLLGAFEVKKELKDDIEKNTTLIICVEVPSFEGGLSQIRNSVLAIEENEGYFKKNVIPYNSGLLRKEDSDLNFSYFSELLSNNAAFSKYRVGDVQDDYYYLAVQLYLKMPFLKVPISLGREFRTIETFMEARMTREQLGLLKRLSGDIDFNEGIWSGLERDILLENPENPDFMDLLSNI